MRDRLAEQFDSAHKITRQFIHEKIQLRVYLCEENLVSMNYGPVQEKQVSGTFLAEQNLSFIKEN